MLFLLQEYIVAIPLVDPTLPLEPNSRRVLHALDGHLVSYQGPDIADPVPDHRGSFETDTPSVDMDVFWESHRFQHFGPEHSTVSDLDPSFELGVESEYLERGLRVWVVGWFEPDVLNTHLLEEDSHEPCEKKRISSWNAGKTTRKNPTYEIGERQIPIGDDALHLMELRQMRRIHRLVPKYPVDTEQLGRSEAILFLGRRHLTRDHTLRLLVKLLSSALGSEFP